MLSKESILYMHIIPKVCKLCYCSTLKVKINDEEKFQALLGLFSQSRRPGGFTPPLETQNTAKIP